MLTEKWYLKANQQQVHGRIYQDTGGQNFFTCERLTTTSHIKNISKEKGVYFTSTQRYLTLRVEKIFITVPRLTSQLPRTVLITGTEILAIYLVR